MRIPEVTDLVWTGMYAFPWQPGDAALRWRRCGWWKRWTAVLTCLKDRPVLVGGLQLDRKPVIFCCFCLRMRTSGRTSGSSCSEDREAVQPSQQLHTQTGPTHQCSRSTTRTRSGRSHKAQNQHPVVVWNWNVSKGSKNHWNSLVAFSAAAGPPHGQSRV